MYFDFDVQKNISCRRAGDIATMATKDVKVKVFKSFRETRNPEFAQIIGEIPVWASGLLLRSCPAK